ncbi:MAG TPA: addiction module protein [Pyrinomonadaceae bacterium]|nr:addiction module protein [Pyrinomonadaceae bacterium]
MDKTLETAAEIRQQLSDRRHSDSTELHFEEILSAAVSLSPGERAMLADHLLASLDGPNQKEIDAAWAEEAERRMREIDEGKVELIDGELVMERLRARFKSSVDK